MNATTLKTILEARDELATAHHARTRPELCRTGGDATVLARYRRIVDGGNTITTMLGRLAALKGEI